ncbi:MAG: hypothetical protein ACE5FU_01020 [Nitrospinota bacterium]
MAGDWVQALNEAEGIKTRSIDLRGIAEKTVALFEGMQVLPVQGICGRKLFFEVV